MFADAVRIAYRAWKQSFTIPFLAALYDRLWYAGQTFAVILV